MTPQEGARLSSLAEDMLVDNKWSSREVIEAWIREMVWKGKAYEKKVFVSNPTKIKIVGYYGEGGVD